jgi:hypothetical protein
MVGTDKEKRDSIVLYHTLYELCETDLYYGQGFEMEKYRQHRKYHEFSEPLKRTVSR